MTALLTACGGGGDSGGGGNAGSGGATGGTGGATGGAGGATGGTGGDGATGGNGGDGGGGGSGSAPATAASPRLTFAAVKAFRFTWTDVGDATHYKLLENPDGASGLAQVGSDIPQGSESVDHVVPLYARLDAQYVLQSCNAIGCTDSGTVSVGSRITDAVGYAKAGNTGVGDGFGNAVSLSNDGNTLAVAAFREDSAASSDPSDNSAQTAGAVYVFTRSGSSWRQEDYIKASNAQADDSFGASVALSGDGNTLAVGASREDGGATGIDGDQSDNSASNAGATYVFIRSGGNWLQEAYIKASNAEADDLFGFAVSLSDDGNTLAVAALGEDSNATGVDGDESNNTEVASGATYVFIRSGGNWLQEAYVKASNSEDSDWFGFAVSLSGDGGTLAVGAPDEDSNATGIDENQSNNSVDAAGAVYVFIRSPIVGVGWTPQAYIKASNTDAGDEFGHAVSLSDNGNTLAVGAHQEASDATGLNGNQGDNSAELAGAVYVFTRLTVGLGGAEWGQRVYLKASNTQAEDRFGYAVSLSGDGGILAVGASREDSSAIGINGNQNDNAAESSGAAYVFTRSGSTWGQQAYVKASNTDAGDEFGFAVALSGSGDTLAVGADAEDSSATGIDGSQGDDTVSASGAVYLY